MAGLFPNGWDVAAGSWDSANSHWGDDPEPATCEPVEPPATGGLVR